jgi:hypothetical protein
MNWVRQPKKREWLHEVRNELKGTANMNGWPQWSISSSSCNLQCRKAFEKLKEKLSAVKGRTILQVSPPKLWLRNVRKLSMRTRYVCFPPCILQKLLVHFSTCQGEFFKSPETCVFVKKKARWFTLAYRYFIRRTLESYCTQIQKYDKDSSLLFIIILIVPLIVQLQY